MIGDVVVTCEWKTRSNAGSQRIAIRHHLGHVFVDSTRGTALYVLSEIAVCLVG